MSFFAVCPNIQCFSSNRSSSSSTRHSKRPDSEKTPAVQSGESKEDYEAEQKRLDREWYGLDEGYDESNNPFSGNFNRSWRKSNTTKFFLIIFRLLQQSNMVILSCLAKKNQNLNSRKKKVQFITESYVFKPETPTNLPF